MLIMWTLHLHVEDSTLNKGMLSIIHFAKTVWELVIAQVQQFKWFFLGRLVDRLILFIGNTVLVGI